MMLSWRKLNDEAHNLIKLWCLMIPQRQNEHKAKSHISRVWSWCVLWMQNGWGFLGLKIGVWNPCSPLWLPTSYFLLLHMNTTSTGPSSRIVFPKSLGPVNFFISAYGRLCFHTPLVEFCFLSKSQPKKFPPKCPFRFVHENGHFQLPFLSIRSDITIIMNFPQRSCLHVCSHFPII